MIIEDQFDVRAKQDDVWAFLLDVESLARCLPGCEEVQDLGEGVYQATAAVQIAFMKLKFDLNVRITEIDPPNWLISEVDGKPKALVGQLKMKAKMNLSNVEEGITKIHYHMDMSMAGKLGSIGQSAFRSKAVEMGALFAENIRKALEPAEIEK